MKQDFQPKNQIIMKLYREVKAKKPPKDWIIGTNGKYIVPIDITEEEINSEADLLASGNIHRKQGFKMGINWMLSKLKGE